MNKLVFHDSIQAQLSAYQSALPQALLLTGPRGIGLYSCARELSESAEEVQVITPQLLTKTSSRPQISVEMIRNLYELARTKTSSQRALIIDDADTMTTGAQNAFLKLLEEPNDSTKFILTSHHPEQLLPTVRSRLQALPLPRLDESVSRGLIESFGVRDTKRQAQMLFIAPGLPAELTRLAGSEDYFETMASRVTLARELLQGTQYQKIAQILKNVTSDRQEAIDLIDQLITLLTLRPTSSSISAIDRLLAARDRIAGGSSIKLQLAAAMV